MGWHFTLYYTFCLCETKARLQRTEKSEKNNIFDRRLKIWDRERGKGEDKNDALALVVQEDFLLRQLRQRRNILPLQKDTLGLASCNCLLTSRRKISHSFPTTYVCICWWNECTTIAKESVSYQYHITIRAWYHVAISRVDIRESYQFHIILASQLFEMLQYWIVAEW